MGGTREAVREKRLAGRRVRAMKAERTGAPAGLRGRAKEKRRAAGRCGSRLARWKEEGAREWASDELGQGRVNGKEGGKSGWAAKQRAKPGRGREKRAGPNLELG